MLQLGPDEIHIYLLSFHAERAQFEDAQLAALLSARERDRYSRFLFEKDRRAFLLSHAMVRLLLAQYSGLCPNCIEFWENRHGKPFPQTNGGAVCPFFSLSHTTTMAACALSLDPELGIDIEDTSRHSDWRSILCSTLRAEERASVAQAANPQERFYEFWTLKEAYVKARGLGFSIPIDEFAMSLEDPNDIRIAFYESLSDNAEAWQFHSFSAGACRLALAVRQRRWNVHVKEIAALGPPLLAREARITLR